jgi:hypothetical protein
LKLLAVAGPQLRFSPTRASFDESNGAIPTQSVLPLKRDTPQEFGNWHTTLLRWPAPALATAATVSGETDADCWPPSSPTPPQAASVMAQKFVYFGWIPKKLNVERYCS